MKSIGFLLIGLVGVVYSFGCAQGSDSFDGDGGGSSGDGGSTQTTTTSSGTGVTTSSGTTSGSTTSASTGSGGTGGGGSECGPEQHSCGGICAGNTPQTGCFTSETCAACTPPPNSGATCSPDGECDFNCNVGYQPSGNTCVCSQECCSNADCPAGETCGGGVCSGPACVMEACIAQCIVMGCIGICMGDCVCVCG